MIKKKEKKKGRLKQKKEKEKKKEKIGKRECWKIKTNFKINEKKTDE